MSAQRHELFHINDFRWHTLILTLDAFMDTEQVLICFGTQLRWFWVGATGGRRVILMTVFSIAGNMKNLLKCQLPRYDTYFDTVYDAPALTVTSRHLKSNVGPNNLTQTKRYLSKKPRFFTRHENPNLSVPKL